MKHLLGSFLFVFIALVLVLVLRTFLPKYSGFLFFFFIFLLSDGYLWRSVRATIRKRRIFARSLLTVLYWLPLALMTGVVAAGFFVSFLEWNLSLRTYLQSFIVMLFLGKVFPVLALILNDLGRVFRWGFHFFLPGKRIALKSIPRKRWASITGWTLGSLVFILLLAGMVFWQFDFRVRRQEISLKDLPPSFDGLKIVQISDVHLGSWGMKSKLVSAMDLINGLHPDVIFFTGDMFNYRTADGYGFEDILRKLHAPYGVYAIMGNHDYGDYISWSSPEAKKKNMEDLKLFYRDLGWKLLLNDHDILRRGADSIAILGVENWGATARFQRLGDVEKAQRGTEKMAVRLLLSHDPTHWDRIISRLYPGIGITFSGHTHGGQIGIDLPGIHKSLVSGLYRHWCGLYACSHARSVQYLYVNQGLGNIGYSGRIGILPEVTLLTLKCGTLTHPN